MSDVVKGQRRCWLPTAPQLSNPDDNDDYFVVASRIGPHDSGLKTVFIQYLNGTEDFWSMRYINAHSVVVGNEGEQASFDESSSPEGYELPNNVNDWLKEY